MARPLRIEFPCALYYISSCSNAQGAIYLKDADRVRFPDLLNLTASRYDWSGTTATN